MTQAKPTDIKIDLENYWRRQMLPVDLFTNDGVFL